MINARTWMEPKRIMLGGKDNLKKSHSMISLMSYFLNDNLQKWRPDQRLIEVREQVDKNIEGDSCDYR